MSSEMKLAATTSKAAPIELTIVMPCLNEAETLRICIDKAQSVIEEA